MPCVSDVSPAEDPERSLIPTETARADFPTSAQLPMHMHCLPIKMPPLYGLKRRACPNDRHFDRNLHHL